LHQGNAGCCRGAVPPATDGAATEPALGAHSCFAAL